MRRFTLTQEHMTLLKHMVVRWDDGEFGAPCIDCKRPYGDSGVIEDMVEILGIEAERDDWTGYPSELVARLTQLHAETETALQIVLRNITGRVPLGEYVADGYSEDWRPG
jgi:hypothetical protein